MQCDQKPGFGHSELTFMSALETAFGASHYGHFSVRICIGPSIGESSASRATPLPQDDSGVAGVNSRFLTGLGAGSERQGFGVGRVWSALFAAWGLKPGSLRTAYAALKRRPSTMVRAFLEFPCKVREKCGARDRAEAVASVFKVAVCACFPPKVHDGTPDSALPDLLFDVSMQ